MRAVARDLGIGRQVLRSAISVLPITQVITQFVTQVVTHPKGDLKSTKSSTCKSDIHNKKPKLQPTLQPKLQPTFDTPDDFDIDPRFAEAWQLWLEYLKQTTRQYKSKRSERIGYDQFIKKSGGNPQRAMEMVQNTIANGYQGLFPAKSYGNNNSTYTGRSEERANVADAAEQILRAIALDNA
jgi:hypothetical protein